MAVVVVEALAARTDAASLAQRLAEVEPRGDARG
jgi:hypothetical protein